VGKGVTAIPVSGDRKVGRQRRGADWDQPVAKPFLAGPENQLIEAAVCAVLEGPSSCYNPLLIYGPTGTGKSHLAHGLAAAWHDRRQRVECITATDFARGLADAYESQAVDDWRRRFRRVDLFVIEGLEQLADQAAAQEELISTLDSLLGEGSQVVATANSSARQLKGLLPGLQSRLSAGLVIPLAPPGPATRLVFLERLAAGGEVPLEKAAARALAEGFKGTMPELIGAVRQLELAAYVDGQQIGLTAAKRFLADRGGAATPSLGEIAAATARCFGVSAGDMRSPSRARAVVTARNAAMYLGRLITGKSLQQIGRYFGGRDHTTVLHGCRKMEQLVKYDPAVQETVDSLLRRWPPGEHHSPQ